MVELPGPPNDFPCKPNDDDIYNLEYAIKFYATERSMEHVLKQMAITILAVIVAIRKHSEDLGRFHK
ncbi:hypothetical protein CWE02_05690 [Brucella pituitosa]|nr:hypothetical protein CWE02_05690 [Brucella pituitosa]